ncbi:unnamed protein product, partial [Clonostachys byssicola]
MEGYLQPSDRSLSDSVSTLDLGPPLIAFDLSSDHGDSSALNTDIEMGPSPVDSPITQAWGDSDWDPMQEPSEPMKLTLTLSLIQSQTLYPISTLNPNQNQHRLLKVALWLTTSLKIIIKLSSGSPGGPCIFGIRLLTFNGK